MVLRCDKKKHFQTFINSYKSTSVTHYHNKEIKRAPNNIPIDNIEKRASNDHMLQRYRRKHRKESRHSKKSVVLHVAKNLIPDILTVFN